MKLLALLAVAVLAQASDCISRPCSSSTNFSFDIAGTLDTRPGSYGNAGAEQGVITFSPPAGYRVRVLRVYGDFIAWASGFPSPGTRSGVLFALSSTLTTPATYADLVSDNCFLYLQDSVSFLKLDTRDPFDFAVQDGGLLAADNKLLLTTAAWLNTTGLSIHMEPSFVIVYTFEKAIFNSKEN
jgi:hypothetical protein